MTFIYVDCGVFFLQVEGPPQVLELILAQAEALLIGELRKSNKLLGMKQTGISVSAR